MADPLVALHARLLTLALAYPDATEDHPWDDHTVVKVRKKIFAFLDVDAETGLRVGVKLPVSGDLALLGDGVEPMGYGLGRHGWVDARFTRRSMPAPGIIEDWIDESYRAVAPKTLVKRLDAAAP